MGAAVLETLQYISGFAVTTGSLFHLNFDIIKAFVFWAIIHMTDKFHNISDDNF